MMATSHSQSQPTSPSMPGSARLMTVKPILPSRKKLALILSAAFALRMAIFAYTDLSHHLQQRPELSTPINSFKSLLEAHFLHQNPPARLQGSSASVYQSGTIHHSPLFLPLLRTPLSCYLDHTNHLLIPLLWSLSDIISGYLIFRIASIRERASLVRKTLVWQWDQSRATKVSLLFLFNPFTIGVCIARSTIVFENLAILASIYAAMTASTLLMSFSWAIASLLALYPALLLPILLQLSIKRAGEAEYEKDAIRLGGGADEGATDIRSLRKAAFISDRMRRAKRRILAKSVVLCPAVLVGGIFVSRAIATSPAANTPLLQAVVESQHLPRQQGWEWAERVYGTILLTTDLTPNLGLWWYFFIEIFDHFRSFFLLTFNVHVACYVLPVFFKYRQDPLFGITMVLGVMAIFKSYPTVGDHSLFLALLSVHDQIFEYMRYPLVSALIYAYCTLLAPAFHHLWLTAGSGNANFFYAITLVWALGGGMLVLDAMWAWGRERWEQERTPIRAKAKPAIENGDEKLTLQEAEKTAEPVKAKTRVVVQI